MAAASPRSCVNSRLAALAIGAAALILSGHGYASAQNDAVRRDRGAASEHGTGLRWWQIQQVHNVRGLRGCRVWVVGEQGQVRRLLHQDMRGRSDHGAGRR